MSDLLYRPAHELAGIVRRREASALEVVDAHLAQIARHNERLNAVVTLDAEGARRRAKEADEAMARGDHWGPLHGVPVTIKDTISTQGMRTTAGYEPLADHVPDEDATAVARYRAAGAIILGKTNMPTLAIDIQSNNPIFGPARNPWNVERTPGGSSGGSAAAVASGMVPLELGSDFAGSVRIPSHYSGVFGVKPTDHRVPGTGHIPELPGEPYTVRHLPQIGPIARCVEDLELALRLIAGPDGKQLEAPPVPFGSAVEKPLNAYRFAWTDRFGDLAVTRDTKAALAAFAAELEGVGCAVEKRAPTGFEFPLVWETWGELGLGQIAATVEPDKLPDMIEDLGLYPDSEDAIARSGATRLEMTYRQYIATLTKRDALTQAVDRFLESWDALLCPVATTPAIPHCDKRTPVKVDDATVPYWMATLGYTCPFNLTGHPSVVLPLAQSSDGLPIGVQIVGKRWGEAELFVIAKRVEAMIGPFRRPQL